MSLKINESGAYERDVEQNWAAAYAKRLVNELEHKHDEDKSVIDASLEAISAEVDERATKTQLDDAVDFIESELAYKASAESVADGSALGDKCIKTRHINPGNVTSGCIHDYDVTEVKLATDSVTTAKIKNLNVTADKLATDSVTNSKLASDVFATVQETRWGDDTHKAVTPNGLKQGIGYIIPASVSSGDFGMDNIPCHSIDADVTSIFHNPVRDAGLREYSETPVQVGTWIDGTPVWRVAISKTLSAADFSAGYYTFSAADWGVSSSLGDISLILNYTLALSPRTDIEDIHFVNLGKNDIGFKLDLSGAQSFYVFLRGFVEFVTPETNIITE